MPYVPGAALVVRKEAAGTGFAEDMQVGEDVNFVWRLGASGWRVRYEPAATMGHQHRVRLREWFARRKDYGTSAAALELRHPGAVRPLYASAWTAVAWLAAALGHPEGGAVVAGTGTALLARRLAQVTGEASAPPGRLGRVAAGRPAGGRRDARRGPAAGQRDLPDLVAGGAAGRDRGAAAAAAAGRAAARAAAARLARIGGRRWIRRGTWPPGCSTTPGTAWGCGRGAWNDGPFGPYCPCCAGVTVTYAGRG